MKRRMRLNSSQVHVNICYKVVHDDAAAFITAGFEDLAPINSAFFEKHWVNTPSPEIIIVLQAACDQPVTIHQNLGCIELNKLLNTISNLQKNQVYKNATFIFPLAESDGRAHWTLVTIKNKEAFFYDPKGNKSCLNFSNFFKRSSILSYNLNPIKQTFNTNGFNLENIHYTKLQPSTNKEACGYVVAHIAGELLNTHPNERSTLTNFRSFDFNKMHNHWETLRDSYRNVYDTILETLPGFASSNDDSDQTDSDVWAFPSDQSVDSSRDEEADGDYNLTQKEVEEGILVSKTQTL